MSSLQPPIQLTVPLQRSAHVNQVPASSEGVDAPGSNDDAVLISQPRAPPPAYSPPASPTASRSRPDPPGASHHPLGRPVSPTTASNSSLSDPPATAKSTARSSSSNHSSSRRTQVSQPASSRGRPPSRPVSSISGHQRGASLPPRGPSPEYRNTTPRPCPRSPSLDSPRIPWANKGKGPDLRRSQISSPGSDASPRTFRPPKCSRRGKFHVEPVLWSSPSPEPLPESLPEPSISHHQTEKPSKRTGGRHYSSSSASSTPRRCARSRSVDSDVGRVLRTLVDSSYSVPPPVAANLAKYWKASMPITLFLSRLMRDFMPVLLPGQNIITAPPIISLMEGDLIDMARNYQRTISFYWKYEKGSLPGSRTVLRVGQMFHSLFLSIAQLDDLYDNFPTAVYYLQQTVRMWEADPNPASLDIGPFDQKRWDKYQERIISQKEHFVSILPAGSTSYMTHMALAWKASQASQQSSSSHSNQRQSSFRGDNRQQSSQSSGHDLGCFLCGSKQHHHSKHVPSTSDFITKVGKTYKDGVAPPAPAPTIMDVDGAAVPTMVPNNIPAPPAVQLDTEDVYPIRTRLRHEAWSELLTWSSGLEKFAKVPEGLRDGFFIGVEDYALTHTHIPPNHPSANTYSHVIADKFDSWFQNVVVLSESKILTLHLPTIYPTHSSADPDIGRQCLSLAFIPTRFSILMSHPNGPNFSDEDLHRWRARFPRAGYWLGVHPTHPFIHGPTIDPAVAAQHAQQNAHALGPPPPYVAPNVHALGPPPPYVAPAGGLPTSAPTVPAPVPGAIMPIPPVHQSVHTSLERFNLSIPVGTDIVRGTISTTSLRLDFTIAFGDFFSRVCAKMELDPLQALIGYKFSDDRVKDPARRLTNDDEFQDALAKVKDKMRRARTREVVMIIHNLRPPSTAAAAAAPTGRTAANKRKRVTEEDSDENAVDSSLKPILRRLKEERACQTHSGRYCFVNPDLEKDNVGRHIQLTIFDLTLWAQKIQLKQATYTVPPNTHGFDPAFKKVRRERQTTVASSSPPPVHVHLGGIHVNGATSETGRSPLRSSSQANTMPLDLTYAADDELIQYPSIDILLADLHQVMPVLNYPQYKDTLVAKGVAYVDVVDTQDRSFYTDIIGMPLAALDNFLSHATRLTRRAKKGKGKAL
ncbi:hypothetical protein K435DRAFT_857992 [Dendrothele bispora CBS 962.96]|uniref:Uncharacterized protein n=1 Tax=Dendrothele bispora (strain CBS 962.96) TaxID=1314807 RepID=A0A4S8M4B3_DENBC|nr:hypothetical protein K435DRAFT_857992 [Dendrothele bispora CBS 962.96]